MTDTATPTSRLSREQLQDLIRRRKEGAEAVSSAAQPLPRRDSNLGPAPLSAAQERLWFFEQLEPGGFTYNMPAAARLTGVVDYFAFHAALSAVVAHHEVLRSVVSWDGERPVQRVLPAEAFEFPVVDLAAVPLESREVQIETLLAREGRRPFDLAKERPVRGVLYRLGPRDHVLSLTMHHIAGDGWSIGLFLRDLGRAYGHFLARESGPPLPVAEWQYGDYAAWQHSEAYEEEIRQHLPFWREALAGAPAALELPTDRPRPVRQSFQGATLYRGLDGATVARIQALARVHKGTLFTVLLAAFRGVLARVAGVDDLVVGTTVAGRNRRELEELVGLFINSVPLRLALGDDPSFSELSSRERDATLAALAHQDVPFERVVREFAGDRDASRSPVFQVLLQVQNIPTTRFDWPGVRLERLEPEVPQAKLDLLVSCEEETGGHYRVIWRWATALFERATMERLADRFEAALAAVLAEPELRLSSWPLLLPAEAEQLRSWNDTAVDYGAAGATLVSLFEAQVARTPDAVAVPG
jgi:hypothetical protein